MSCGDAVFGGPGAGLRSGWRGTKQSGRHSPVSYRAGFRILPRPAMGHGRRRISDRTGVRWAGRSSPSQCGVVTKPGFSSRPSALGELIKMQTATPRAEDARGVAEIYRLPRRAEFRSAAGRLSSALESDRLQACLEFVAAGVNGGGEYVPARPAQNVPRARW